MNNLDAVGQALASLFGRPFERVFTPSSGCADDNSRLLKQAAKPKSRVIQKLLKAKWESDRKNYRAKQDILRQLVMEDPKAFKIDSESPGGIIGLTHRSGFRIHTKRRTLPATLTRI